MMPGLVLVVALAVPWVQVALCVQAVLWVEELVVEFAVLVALWVEEQVSGQEQHEGEVE
jgi:hypothetical protein